MHPVGAFTWFKRELVGKGGVLSSGFFSKSGFIFISAALILFIYVRLPIVLPFRRLESKGRLALLSIRVANLRACNTIVYVCLAPYSDSGVPGQASLE